jgi:hypothetical protein
MLGDYAARTPGVACAPNESFDGKPQQAATSTSGSLAITLLQSPLLLTSWRKTSLES